MATYKERCANSRFDNTPNERTVDQLINNKLKSICDLLIDSFVIIVALPGKTRLTKEDAFPNGESCLHFAWNFPQTITDNWRALRPFDGDGSFWSSYTLSNDLISSTSVSLLCFFFVSKSFWFQFVTFSFLIFDNCLCPCVLIFI